MKLAQHHWEYIKAKFLSIRNEDDLFNVLHIAGIYFFQGSVGVNSVKKLKYFAIARNRKHGYRHFNIKKKNGGERQILAPRGDLKNLLQILNLILQNMHESHEAATGFTPGKSIAHNALIHIKNHYVYNIDLKDFFSSFDQNRVKMMLMHPPFLLKDEREPLAWLLSNLLTCPMETDGLVKSVLPTGSPASPTLSNMLCYRMDEKLTRLARNFGVNYSRYADDISFSGSSNIFVSEAFQWRLYHIIETQEGLRVNQQKIRLQKHTHRQEVTGIVVNEHINLKQKYLKTIRMWIYYWERYGYENAQELFLKDYMADKGHIKNPRKSLRYVLVGKLEYLKMIKGKENATYQKLRMRYDKLVKSLNPDVSLW